MPLCLYHTSQQTHPSASPHQQSILGQRPQAYTVTPSPAPIDMTTTFRTMSLTPLDSTWYMDISSSSHIVASQGNLSSYFNLSKNNGITVGSGKSIPGHRYGHTSLPPPTHHYH